MTDSVSRKQDIFPKVSSIDSKMTDVHADAGADLDMEFDTKALFQHTFTQDITHFSKHVQEEGSGSQSQSRPLTSANTTTIIMTTTTILKGRRRSSPPTLVTLPAELVLIIASHLEYPDVLSLRQSHAGLSGVLSRHSTTHDRISWVLSRAYLGLPIPNNTGLSFKTDDLFLSNREVQRILAARMNHGECLSSSSADLIPARQLARTRLGRRKGDNLCFVEGAGPCPAVLARRRREKRNRRHRSTMTTTRQNSSALGRNLFAFFCVVPLLAVAVEAGRHIRERAPGWSHWVDVFGCLLLLSSSLLLAGWYLTQRH